MFKTPVPGSKFKVADIKFKVQSSELDCTATLSNFEP
jgi:hypothetical protein